MESTILAETEAFISRQREALLDQRQELLNQQRAIQEQLDQVDQMLTKFDVFEGKYARRGATRKAGRRRASAGRRGSRREELMKVIRSGHGLTRGEILEKMGLKGKKAGEMSVSNALTALTKSNQVRKDGRKYLAA
jgi:stage III sporulation protein SpoIIIAA